MRFTEPLENYDHEHQTPRVEGGREYGDLVKFMDFHFLGNVTRDNAEVLRQLALPPSRRSPAASHFDSNRGLLGGREQSAGRWALPSTDLRFNHSSETV